MIVWIYNNDSKAIKKNHKKADVAITSAFLAKI